MRIVLLATFFVAALFALSGCGDEQPAASSSPAPSTASPSNQPGSATSRASDLNPPVEEHGFDGRRADIIAERRELDRTVWAPEMLALRYERALIEIWDALNEAENPLSELGNRLVFNTLKMPIPAGKTVTHEHGVLHTRYAQPSDETVATQVLTPQEFRKGVADMVGASYQLEMSDWHLSSFTPARGDQPARSTVNVSFYAVQRSALLYNAIHAVLDVTWEPLPADPVATPRMRDIRVEEVLVTQRTGEHPFDLAFQFNPASQLNRPSSVQPILVRDLDGNGYDDIIVVGVNIVFMNKGPGRFVRRTFIEQPPEAFHSAALLADLTGDGITDFLCASHGTTAGKLLLYRGTAEGMFPDAPEAIELESGPLVNMHAVTAGDIDGDGDLDLFVAQYKPPSVYGQMPRPYHDSNDGFPWFMLRNEGGGRFVDVTEEAGLGEKRRRRVYSASLIDLNDDRALDLVTVSDFRGVDVFVNNGSGGFDDITDTAVDRPHGFGMAHAFDDYDLDGNVDLYMIGMTSATADRLDSMGLTRSDMPQIAEHRSEMVYGNRLYQINDTGSGLVFDQTTLADQVARTGWSWGVATFDLENDGDRDLYVANGNLTGASVEDYCSVFWRHDMYSGDSRNDPEMLDVFLYEMRSMHERKTSWDGRQKNALFMNQGGDGFVSAAYPMGVAFEYDARSAAAVDLDGDGLDELMVVAENRGGGGQTLNVYHNRLKDAGHWLGLRFPYSGARSHLNGVKVVLSAGGTERVIKPVTENAFVLPQLPGVVRFGLGEVDSVDWVEARFLDGTVWRVEGPAVDKYHAVAGE